MDEGADTELEQSKRRCVGGAYRCRRGGHRLRANLETLFLIDVRGESKRGLFLSWRGGLVCSVVYVFLSSS